MSRKRASLPEDVAAELDAIETIVRALEALPDDARKRAWKFVTDRFIRVQPIDAREGEGQ